jgi:hypothetical protein
MERLKTNLSVLDYKTLELSREIVLNDYDTAVKHNTELFINGDVKASSSYIYNNQKEDANCICNTFYTTNKRVVSIIKRTKVGMDGLMIEIAKLITTHSDDNFVLHRNNIFFITGMSNKSWENDMKDKIPACFKNNVYHHGQLQNLQPKLKNIKNAILIIDEIDNGDKEKQKLHKLLEVNGLLDIKYIEENNIRFVFVSATMIHELKCLDNWGDIHFTHYMQIPANYIGHKDFLELGIIQEYYEINNNKLAEKWIETDIINRYTTDFRVHIIRTDAKNKDYIYNACKKFKINFKNHTSDDRISYEDLKSIFDDITNHIVIAVKGFFRRANLIPNEWKLKIGAMHEKFCKKPDTNVQVQGLPGRMTGYWKNKILDGHKTGPYRTAINAINEYEEFYKNPFNKMKYNTNSSKKLFVDPKNIKNLEVRPNEIVVSNKRIPIIINNLNENNIIFNKSLKREEKIKIIFELLKRKTEDKYKKLYNFITNTDEVYCLQITQPESIDSYKKHITDIVNASIKNIATFIDIKEEYKTVNNWQVFIDNKEKRLCFVLWCIDHELYVD